jgi:hypothetical protein
MHRMCSLLLVLLLSLLMLSPSDALEEIPQLPQLPRGWQGSCEAHGVASECSVWRDGPAYRLVFLDFVHGGVGIAFGLPGMPTAVRVTVDTPSAPPSTRIIPTEMRGLEAFYFEVELLDASLLFLELQSPVPQLVTVPLDGLQKALDILHDTTEKWRRQTTRKKR